ncbi:CTD kinase subunit beta [Schizosaccharomyces pombe]|uniref:CTD kinase subunit beta n=1 Tax=Schizosaccharomyces pombe (strain 972 / ATCC 24843) TaxID=284812 RepID=CTK2_SCHPO
MAENENHVLSIRMSHPYYSEKEISRILSTRDPKENNLRMQAFAWISTLSKTLKFPVRTSGLAMLLYSRFQLFFPVNEIPLLECATACLVVASKIEDTAKKFRDILLAHYLQKHPGSEVDAHSQLIEENKKRILGLERMTLELICFDFRVRHPHNYMVKFAKSLKFSSSTASIAWNVCTDAYKTYTMLKYPAHIVAVASISIACKLQQLPQPIIPRSFFAPPALTEAVIADILDLYMHYQPHTCIGNMYTTEKLLGLCVDFQRAQKNSGRPQKPPQIDPHSSSLADEYRESNKRLQESKESCARFILDCDRKYFNTEFEKRMLEERRNKGTV